MKEIEHAVVYGRCYTIRNLLQPLFPEQLFLTQDLSNAIQKIKRKHQITGSDASHLLKFLLKKQKEDPAMFVQPLINADSDRLCGIFWMTSVELLMGQVGSGQLPYPTRSIGSGRVTGQNGSEWVRRVLNLTNQ